MTEYEPALLIEDSVTEADAVEGVDVVTLERDAFADAPPPPPPPPPVDGSVELIGRRVEEAADGSAPRWSYPRSSAPAHFLTVPSLGPVGRRRHPLTIIALSVLTLGAYLVRWHVRVNREITEFDARVEARPRLSGLAMLVPWVGGVAGSLLGAAALLLGGMPHQLIALGHSGAIGLATAAGGIGILALLFPPSLITALMTLERIRQVEERVGMGSEEQLRPVARLWWLAVPVIGFIGHLVGAQRRLNAVWATVQPRGTTPPS